MMICNECVHKAVCIYRARVLLTGDFNVEDCDCYKLEEAVDIYKIAEGIAETTKQVTLAHLRMICDNEGD